MDAVTSEEQPLINASSGARGDRIIWVAAVDLQCLHRPRTAPQLNGGCAVGIDPLEPLTLKLPERKFDAAGRYIYICATPSENLDGDSDLFLSPLFFFWGGGQRSSGMWSVRQAPLVFARRSHMCISIMVARSRYGFCPLRTRFSQPERCGCRHAGTPNVQKSLGRVFAVPWRIDLPGGTAAVMI